MVAWDQRGAGLSFAARRPETGMTVEQFIADTRELTLLLCQRLQQPRIYLVGHSWGSLLGALTVQRHPELYYAYVGVGQAVDMREGERISYEWTLDQARQAGDTRSVARLVAIGPPPYTGELRPKLMTQRRILAKYGGEVHGNPGGGMSTLLRGLFRQPDLPGQVRQRVRVGIALDLRPESGPYRAHDREPAHRPDLAADASVLVHRRRTAPGGVQRRVVRAHSFYLLTDGAL
jgi:pimeloyl-ACP methyl ester carboxylesterase